MIYWVVAMPSEARPIIRRFGFRRRNFPCRFELYETTSQKKCNEPSLSEKQKTVTDDTPEAVMVVSGTGRDHAMIATAFLLGLYPPGTPGDCLVQMGVCGAAKGEALPGQAYQCLKLEPKENQQGKRKRELYPEYQSDLRLPGAHLYTADEVVREAFAKSDGFLPTLYDMEGFAVLETAGRFLDSHQMLCVKVVSDFLSDFEQVSSEKISALLSDALEIVASFLSDKMQAKTSDTIHEDGIVERLSKEWQASVSMRRELESLCHYAWLLFQGQTDKLWAWLRERGWLQEAKDRREGKARITAFKDELRQFFAITPASLTKRSFCERFSCIYVEEDLLEDRMTQNILDRLKERSVVVPISGYQNIFNRSRQSFRVQKTKQALILAKKEGELVYEGAPMCHNYGFQNFCYTSCVMNCMYDCEYCYLQGMYPCGHMVAFVNLEDIFQAVKKRAGGQPMYLSVSFDTDLLAMEGILGYAGQWVAFAKDHPNITVELRTKSSAEYFLNMQHERMLKKGEAPPQNCLLSWSLSPPEQVILPLEHHTASLLLRLQGIARAMEDGWNVRLCFDPIVLVAGWKEAYRKLVRQVFAYLPKEPWDVSVGVFRVSNEYLSRMRRHCPESPVVWYPYEADPKRGASYSDRQISEAFEWLVEELVKFIPREKCFLWKEDV